MSIWTLDAGTLGAKVDAIERSFREGEVVAYQDDSPGAIHAVSRGWICVDVYTFQARSAIELVGPGGIVDLAGALTGRGYAMEVYALTDCTLAEFDATAVQRAARDDADMAREITDFLAEHLLLIYAKLRERHSQAAYRIARVLLSLYERGLFVGYGEIAKLAGVADKTAVRTVHKLEAMGFVERSEPRAGEVEWRISNARTFVRVLDADALARRVEPMPDVPMNRVL